MSNAKENCFVIFLLKAFLNLPLSIHVNLDKEKNKGKKKMSKAPIIRTSYRQFTGATIWDISHFLHKYSVADSFPIKCQNK